MPRAPTTAETEIAADAVADAKRSKRLVNTAFSVGIGSVFQPLQVSKVLIQLGHEPYPLQKGRAWGFFGRQKNYLPNGFSYAYKLHQKFGLSGIYRGVSASICGNFVGIMTTMMAEDHLGKYYGMADDEENALPSAPDTNADSRKFIRKVVRGSLSKTAGIIVARPFQVVMIRMIAQHVGGEEVYQGVFSSMRQIYKEEGLPGLFSGLLPQIACELCIYWTVSSATYLLEYLWKAYVEKEERIDDLEEERVEATPPKPLKNAIFFMVPYVVNSIFYPLQLVSTVMAVNGSVLKAGNPLFVPIYSTWQDCFHDLSAKDQLKRGSKMFFRFYEKPILYSNGDIFATPNA